MATRESKEQRMERSSTYFYVCAHDASNSPCGKCHPADAKTMPNNWQKKYDPPAPPGATDAIK